MIAITEVKMVSGQEQIVPALTLNWNLAVIIYSTISYFGLKKKWSLWTDSLWPEIQLPAGHGDAERSHMQPWLGSKVPEDVCWRDTVPAFNVPSNGVEWFHLSRVFTVPLLCTKIPFFSVPSRPRSFPKPLYSVISDSPKICFKVISSSPLTHHLSLPPELFPLSSSFLFLSLLI